MLPDIRARFRQVRREVYEQATRPSSDDVASHTANKQLFRQRVEGICAAANLAHYRAATAQAKSALWRHLWTKNRYAGIKAQIASDEIDDLTPLFDNYAWFSDAGWDIQAHGHIVNPGGTGRHARDFLAHSGTFAGARVVANVPKLKKIVATGRAFDQYFIQHPHAPALQFVTATLPENSVWQIHAHLLRIGYGADLTALHFMMDAGFRVIKPNVVVTRLFLDWGWLRHAAPDLPADLTRCDLIGKGHYGLRFHYTKRIVYRPVINLARDIVAGLSPHDLAVDIGWVTSNLLREFDIFVVKAGQIPEHQFGIEQRLYP